MTGENNTNRELQKALRGAFLERHYPCVLMTDKNLDDYGELEIC